MFLNETRNVGVDVEDERIWIWIVVGGVWSSGGQVWDGGSEEVGSVELCFGLEDVGSGGG